MYNPSHNVTPHQTEPRQSAWTPWFYNKVFNTGIYLIIEAITCQAVTDAFFVSLVSSVHRSCHLCVIV